MYWIGLISFLWFTNDSIRTFQCDGIYHDNKIIATPSNFALLRIQMEAVSGRLVDLGLNWPETKSIQTQINPICFRVTVRQSVEARYMVVYWLDFVRLWNGGTDLLLPLTRINGGFSDYKSTPSANAHINSHGYGFIWNHDRSWCSFSRDCDFLIHVKQPYPRSNFLHLTMVIFDL